MHKEEWKDIPDFEGLYSVSTYGRIRSYPRKCWNGVGFFMLKERVMKLQDNGKGYLQIMLNAGGAPKLFYVHRLVLLTFVGPPNGLETNHKNGIKKDNTLWNLEYVTSSQNILHAWETGLFSIESQERFKNAGRFKRSEETKQKMSAASKKSWQKRKGLI